MKLIKDMQLLDKTNDRSSTLSGGMKRKLKYVNHYSCNIDSYVSLQ